MRCSCYLDTATFSHWVRRLLLFVNTESSTIELSKVFILLFTPNEKHYMYIYTVNWAPPSNILFTMFLKMAIYRSMTSSETSPKHQHHILPKIISRHLLEGNNPNRSMPLHFFVIKTEMCATLPSKNNK